MVKPTDIDHFGTSRQFSIPTISITVSDSISVALLSSHPILDWNGSCSVYFAWNSICSGRMSKNYIFVKNAIRCLCCCNCRCLKTISVGLKIALDCSRKINEKLPATAQQFNWRECSLMCFADCLLCLLIISPKVYNNCAAFAEVEWVLSFLWQNKTNYFSIFMEVVLFFSKKRTNGGQKKPVQSPANHFCERRGGGGCERVTEWQSE